jgi:hypothetical protein
MPEMTSYFLRKGSDLNFEFNWNHDLVPGYGNKRGTAIDYMTQDIRKVKPFWSLVNQISQNECKNVERKISTEKEIVRQNFAKEEVDQNIGPLSSEDLTKKDSGKHNEEDCEENVNQLSLSQIFEELALELQEQMVEQELEHQFQINTVQEKLLKNENEIESLQIDLSRKTEETAAMKKEFQGKTKKLADEVKKLTSKQKKWDERGTDIHEDFVENVEELSLSQIFEELMLGFQEQMLEQEQEHQFQMNKVTEKLLESETEIESLKMDLSKKTGKFATMRQEFESETKNLVDKVEKLKAETKKQDISIKVVEENNPLKDQIPNQTEELTGELKGDEAEIINLRLVQKNQVESLHQEFEPERQKDALVSKELNVLIDQSNSDPKEAQTELDSFGTAQKNSIDALKQELEEERHQWTITAKQLESTIENLKCDLKTSQEENDNLKRAQKNQIEAMKQGFEEERQQFQDVPKQFQSVIEKVTFELKSTQEENENFRKTQKILIEAMHHGFDAERQQFLDSTKLFNSVIENLKCDLKTTQDENDNLKTAQKHQIEAIKQGFQEEQQQFQDVDKQFKSAIEKLRFDLKTTQDENKILKTGHINQVETLKLGFEEERRHLFCEIEKLRQKAKEQQTVQERQCVPSYSLYSSLANPGMIHHISFTDVI